MNSDSTKSSSVRHISKLIVLTLSVLGASAGLFQNCSKVDVSDLTEDERNAAARVARIGADEVVVEVGNSQYEKSMAQFEVGLDSVPPLKQLWIVDNSGTMVANNINLANSFGAMFSQSNKDSLYKFDTTAFLLNTAQTVPSYKATSSRSFLQEIVNLQNAFNAHPQITESEFSSLYRTADLNSGRLPGDNVGTQIARTASSSTDFRISAAPVLGRAADGEFSLVASFNKPANQDTTDFEEEFSQRLGVLRYQRVPKVTTQSGGIFIENAQSAQILDRESGLCGLARVLDNPNGMFDSNSLLAVTIVSDENENDVQGLNCLKRTAYIQGNENYVSGKCVEYRTPFSLQMRNRDPKTCTLNGQAGYRAEFPYVVYSAEISYYQRRTAASISSSTPQTRISWQTPTTNQQFEQQRTPVRYYTWRNVPATYDYYLRQITVKYFTKVCTQTNADGTSVLKCVASQNPVTKVLDGTSYSTCANAAKAYDSNAVTETSQYITADKLPDCSTPTQEKPVANCNTADSLNCRPVLKTAATVAIDRGPIETFLVGDRVADCDSALSSQFSNVVLSTNTNFTDVYKPRCSSSSWPIINPSTCTSSTTCRVLTVPGAPANGSQIVLGRLTDGSSGCLTNSVVPANAISGSVRCSFEPAKVTTAACTAQELAAGCASQSIAATFGYSPKAPVPNIKSRAECESWVSGRSDNATSVSNPIVCDLKNEPKFVRSNRTFVEVSNSTMNVGDLCGDASTIFYNALSSTDKSLVVAADVNKCKIVAINNGTSRVRPLLAESTCETQKNSDCSAINYRNCSTAESGGGFTASYSAWTQFMAVQDKDVSCSSICKNLPAGKCEGWSDQNITVLQYLQAKYGSDVQVNCKVEPAQEVTPVISTITDRPVSEQASFCAKAEDGTNRYFVATTTPAPKEQYVDEFVAGNSADGLSPQSDLIQFIKKKIEQRNLNINISLFIRRSQDPDGVGSGINYKGVDYERLIQELVTPSALNGQPLATGQVFSVLDSSYESALTNLSAVLKGKLIRSFTIPQLQDHQVVTAVKIVSGNQEKNLALGQWNQSGKVINIAKEIVINEGDSISIQYQNDDGYVYAQLKKVFIIDQMRPDQIVKSIDHIKNSGLVVTLNPDQWIKEGNRITIIDTKVVIDGGDRFHIFYKNDVDED